MKAHAFSRHRIFNTFATRIRTVLLLFSKFDMVAALGIGKRFCRRSSVRQKRASSLLISYDLVRDRRTSSSSTALGLPAPWMRDGDSGHELRQALLELDADALGSNRASPSPSPTARRGLGLVIIVVSAAVVLLAGLENLKSI